MVSIFFFGCDVDHYNIAEFKIKYWNAAVKVWFIFYIYAWQVLQDWVYVLMQKIKRHQSPVPIKHRRKVHETWMVGRIFLFPFVVFLLMV